MLLRLTESINTETQHQPSQILRVLTNLPFGLCKAACTVSICVDVREGEGVETYQEGQREKGGGVERDLGFIFLKQDKNKDCCYPQVDFYSKLLIAQQCDDGFSHNVLTIFRFQIYS